MARHTARSASPHAAAAAVLFLCLLPAACGAAGGVSGGKPSAVLLPVSKDAATQQYVTEFRQRTPLVPVKAVLDLAGTTLWVDCESGYASSTYRRVPCGSRPCRLSRSPACATTCPGAPSPSCLNDTCGGFPENTATQVGTSGNLITDVLALPTATSSRPAPLATAPAFLFACGATFLKRGLAKGAAGMASLSRARFALPTQLAATFRFSRKFALCLPSSAAAAAAGAVVFGDAPYAFQPGFVLSEDSLVHTPLLVNPVSTAGVSTKGDKSDEYFVGVTGVKVNGRAVPLNATLLAIDGEGVGGTKLSTVAAYTVLESSIYKAVTAAFAAETAKIPRAPAVPPFKLCYDGSKVGSTRVGPAVPTVELVLGNEATSWVVFGANSMVATEGGALCLGVVDGGRAPRTSVVIGGHMMEDNLLVFDLKASRLGFSSSLLFRQTTCSNFHLG